MSVNLSQLPNLTINQILLLNSGILSFIEEWVRRTLWQDLNISPDGKIAWGICKRENKRSYRVVVDLEQLHHSKCCQGMNNNIYCAHILGLLCMLVRHPDLFTQSDPDMHSFVRTWFKRIDREEKQREIRDERVQHLSNPFKREEINHIRKKRVEDGFEALTLWLINMLKHGLADEQVGDVKMWEKWAERMLDVDAPAVSEKLSLMGATVENGLRDKYDTGWQERLFADMSQLYLLVHSFKRFDALSEGKQADLRTAVGWHYHLNELTEGVVVEDDWVVLGTCEAAIIGKMLRQKRTWLRGINSGKDALLIEHSDAIEPFPLSLKAGDVGHGELVYRPSNAPLEAFIRHWCEPKPNVQRYVTGRSIQENLDAYREAAEANPWMTKFPFLLEDVVLIRHGYKWVVRDPHGMLFPFSVPTTSSVGDASYIGFTGERPFRLAAEWDGHKLVPIGITAYGKIVDFPKPHIHHESKYKVRRRGIYNSQKRWMGVAVVGTNLSDEETIKSFPEAAVLATQLPDVSVEQLIYLTIANQMLQEKFDISDEEPFDEPLRPAPIANPQFTDELHDCFRVVSRLSQHRNLLPCDFIRFAHTHRLQIPNKHLASVLHKGTMYPLWREEVAELLGERGRWLGKRLASKKGLILSWNWMDHLASDADYETLCQSENKDQRNDAFHKLRGHNPDRARALLEQQPIEEINLDWLNVFSTGLSMDDELFLERLLKAPRIKRLKIQPEGAREIAQEKMRRGGITLRRMRSNGRTNHREEHKHCAIHCLAQLPDSHFCQRMIERMEMYVEINVLSQSPIRLELKIARDDYDAMKKQSETDKTMSQDGLDSNSGVRWVLGYVPPRYWYDKWGVAPKQLVEAFTSIFSERGYPIHYPLSELLQSAIYAQDEQLLLEIVSAEEYHKNRTTRTSREMSDLLSADLLRKVAQRCLEESSMYTQYDHVASSYLDALRQKKQFAWDHPLTHAYINSVMQYLHSDKRDIKTSESICKRLQAYIHCLPIDMKEPLLDVFTLGVSSSNDKKEANMWSDLMDHVAFWLDFREEMYSVIMRVDQNK